MNLQPHVPCAAPVVRGSAGQGLALIGPILELDEPACVGTVGIELPEASEFGHRPIGVERPEGGLENFHRQRAECLPRLRDRAAVPHGAGPQGRQGGEVRGGREGREGLLADGIERGRVVQV